MSAIVYYSLKGTYCTSTHWWTIMEH